MFRVILMGCSLTQSAGWLVQWMQTALLDIGRDVSCIVGVQMTVVFQHVTASPKSAPKRGCCRAAAPNTS